MICVAQKMGFTERRKSPSPEIIKCCKKIVGKLITTANSQSALVLLFNNHRTDGKPKFIDSNKSQ